MLTALREYLSEACTEEELRRLLYDILNGFDYLKHATGTDYEARVFSVLLYLDQQHGLAVITLVAQEAVQKYGHRPKVVALGQAVEAFLPKAPPGNPAGPAPAQAPPGPVAAPAGVPVKLPPELVRALALYEPRTETVWLVARTLRSQFERAVPRVFDPPHLFHLSAEDRHRLAAVLALERAPDPAYLWWLAERVTIEQPVLGFLAAKALTATARLLKRPDIPRLRSAANAALDRLGDMMNAAALPATVPLDGARSRREAELVEYDAVARKAEVDAAVSLIVMRTVPRGQFLSPDDLEKFLDEMIRVFQRPQLEQLCQAVHLPLRLLARDDDPIQHCVIYLVIRAREARFERELVRKALEAFPDNGVFRAMQQTDGTDRMGA
jgi:hypothetical protein